MPADVARLALARRFMAKHEDEAAEVLERYPVAEVSSTLTSQDPIAAARVMERMLPQRLANVLQSLEDRAVREIVPEIIPRSTASALRWLDESERASILAKLSGTYASQVSEQISYPDDTAGALMDPRAVVVRETDRVGDAIASLREIGRPVHQVYVVDEDQHLLGTVPIRELAIADHETTIASLVQPSRAALDAFASRDEVADLLSETALPSIAVVDRKGRFLGVLRHRTLLGVAEQEAAVAMQRMVGANRDESALSPVTFAVRKRLPWLNINLLTAFLAASVVGLFESTIAQVTSLAVLLPVVAGQSGNSGSQALAVTMRSLALREIDTRDWLRVALKETTVGILNGLAIAVVTAAGVFVWSRSWALAAVISVSMVVAMAAAGLSGASIPVLLKRLGQDPAQSSSIILTTVTDIVGFFTFLGLASAMMRYLI